VLEGFSTSCAIASIQVANQYFPAKPQITKQDSRLWVCDTTFTHLIPLVTMNLGGVIPTFGYSTIFATTEFDQSDNNHLYSVRTQAESRVQRLPINAKLARFLIATARGGVRRNRRGLVAVFINRYRQETLAGAGKCVSNGDMRGYLKRQLAGFAAPVRGAIAEAAVPE
jgi:hypothetical protein